MRDGDESYLGPEYHGAAFDGEEEHHAMQKVHADLDVVKNNPAAIAEIEDPAPEVQLAAIAKRIDVYWKIRRPSEAAAIEYLCRRPYDIQRFREIPDAAKAMVIARSPELIYDWIKRGYIRSPAEPDGFHHAVIREFLVRLMRNISGRLIMSTITRMKAIGYDWPEFNAIERSIKADEKNART